MTPDKTALEAADEMLLHREKCAARLRNADIFIGIGKLSNWHWPDKAIWHYDVDCYWFGGDKPVTEKYHFGHMEAVLAFLRTGIDQTPPSETEVKHE